MVNKNNLNMETLICQNKDLDATDLDGEKVMMNLNKGRYYGLNSVGSRIWELAKDQISISDIIDTLKNEYDVEPSLCETSVLEFLSLLLKEDIICVVR